MWDSRVVAGVNKGQSEKSNQIGLFLSRGICDRGLPFWADVRKNLGIELILENVEGGDGAIVAAKEEFAEDPPQKNGQSGGDDVHHL